MENHNEQFLALPGTGPLRTEAPIPERKLMNIHDGVRLGQRGQHRGRIRSFATVFVAACALSLGTSGGVAGASAVHHPTKVAAKGKLTASQVASLEAALTAGRRPSHWRAGGPAFSAKGLKGKTLFLLNDGTNQFSASFASGVEAATKDVGMTFETGSGNSSTTQDVQVLENAVNAHVSVIVLTAETPSTLSSALLRAKAAGIPVIETFIGDPHLPSAADKSIGIYADATYCYSCTGALAAEYEILKHNGVMDSQVSQFPGSPPSDATALGWVKTLKSYCQKSCKVVDNNLSLSGNYVQAIQQATQVATQGGQINVMFPVYDFQMGFMLPEIEAAGAQKRIDMASENADLAQMQELKAGISVKVDVGNPVAWDGWGAVDQALRALKKLPAVADEKVPVRLFDTSNVNSINLSANPASWYGGATYGADYLRLWGLH